MKLSQWHDGSIKPVHVGVYERDIYEDCFKFSFWDGNQWLVACSDVGEANSHQYKEWHQKSAFQNDLQWRGIVKDKK